MDPESVWTSLPLWPAPQRDQLCGTRHGRCQVHPGQVLQGLPSRECLCVVCDGVKVWSCVGYEGVCDVRVWRGLHVGE